MPSKKPLTPKQFNSKTKKYLATRKPLKGKQAAKTAKARTAYYTKGSKLMKDVETTLKQIAAKHPDPKARKKAKVAVKKLDDAKTAFGSASMCQGVIFDSSNG
jgi:hypothetical protein